MDNFFNIIRLTSPSLMTGFYGSSDKHNLNENGDCITMGLDMYLNATKTLSPRKRKEKVYINYFNTLNEPDVDSDEGLFISEYWGNGKEILANMKDFPILDGQLGKIQTIKRIGDVWLVKTEAGYWRKANQIHNWFVKHTQDGIDDCQYTNVSAEQLEALQLTIKKALRGISKLPDDNQQFMDYNWKPSAKTVKSFDELLPSTSGFFFGSTEYDKYYLSDLFYTKDLLKQLLRKASKDNWEFSYHSSW